jgi:septal ring factor EnvC (AmiA/AmiB activator)
LGTVSLPVDEDEEVSIFDWTAETIVSKQRQETLLQSVIDDRDAKVKQLESQIEDLVEAKKSYEEEVLQKFCLLLNEKKAKIRELQMIIAEQFTGSGKCLSSLYTLGNLLDHFFFSM